VLDHTIAMRDTQGAQVRSANLIDNPSADSLVIRSYPNRTFAPMRSWRLPARTSGRCLAARRTDRVRVPQSGSDPFCTTNSERRHPDTGIGSDGYPHALLDGTGWAERLCCMRF